MGVSNKVNDYLSVLRLEPPNRECGVWAEDAKRSPPDRCLDSFSGFAFCPIELRVEDSCRFGQEGDRHRQLNCALKRF